MPICVRVLTVLLQYAVVVVVVVQTLWKRNENALRSLDGMGIHTHKHTLTQALVDITIFASMEMVTKWICAPLNVPPAGLDYWWITKAGIPHK